MSSPTGGPDRRLAVYAYGAAGLAGASALVSAYWTAGGTALLSTVGGGIEDLARRGGAVAIAGGALVVAMKAAGCVLALALVRPAGSRLPARLLEGVARAAGAFLALYGGVLVAVGAVALTGLLGEPSAPGPLRWHVVLWDPWFLLWGVLLLLAARRRRRLRKQPAARQSLQSL